MLSSKSLIVLLLAVSAAAAACGCGASKNEVQRMGRIVETELPIGSTEAQVEKFLNDRKLIHVPAFVDPDDTRPRYRKLRRMGGTITTFWGNEPALYLSFYFDNNGKLVESTISNACGFGCYSVRPSKSLDASGGAVFSDLCD